MQAACIPLYTERDLCAKVPSLDQERIHRMIQKLAQFTDIKCEDYGYEAGFSTLLIGREVSRVSNRVPCGGSNGLMSLLSFFTLR
ncbi:hypothetical protein F2Q69_00004633 [Brassica cretica]|uniref:Uncharacterized protein n=1 Tax=Brassica cretica TaxID=69181 RepID=A0A8S9P6Z2_BRACR|nr:hypothetical protein F2Q69_00004633 [Brassica cretica]